jgi:hypothetical protein
MFIKRTRDRKRKGEKSKGERVGSGSEVVVERKLERESQDLDLALSPSFLSTPLEGAAVGIAMGGISHQSNRNTQNNIVCTHKSKEERKGMVSNRMDSPLCLVGSRTAANIEFSP